ncbi:MAG: hypothetical protein GW762_04060 [Candidatus Pacebacteria bacterium]|nr:hypothetical protein [Candidatus Paceibacterota bacterium]PIR63575.1 MAG: hypothetical protein COU64_03920 [Candidatus Pacebacteria bacterium CG10_big_fil_rev_8_21_14_0_10_40_26]PIZ79232.1 MAG: hypothetical protein COY01_02295 [Candidatus Pacebacteria bacterium CG_4_10_14_0_2_um_filter_40_20]PJA68887.1 MAG: hypothetical protein CO156_02900 [Candidatus Pacebacteria bacterium CG_4_9_14_3_um_filter_40_12]PJC42199.1 MAG: hypothetical protein CO041_01005 [Candidatus Pacebacteria bacterium CG_4_9_
MQAFDINVLSLWLIFILELIIAGIVLSAHSKTKNFERDYKKAIKDTQKELEDVVTDTAREASESLDEVSSVARTAAQQIHELSERLKEEIETSLLTETKAQLSNLESSAKEQIAELNQELIGAVSHTKSQMNSLLLAHVKEATKEIDTYRDEQKSALAEKAANQVQLVAKQYLSENLSKEQVHTLCLALISKTLEVRSTPSTKEKSA